MAFSPRPTCSSPHAQLQNILKATKMDRPGAVEAHPKTGKVYVVMTNNTRRTPEQVDKANPRPDNNHRQCVL